MKRLVYSILCISFFSLTCIADLWAQNENGDEFYYSNPQKGIKATAPTPYYDTTVVSMSDNLTVELVGETADDTVHRDSIKGTFDRDGYYDFAYTARINRFHRGMSWSYYDPWYTDLYWYTSNPYYWGASIYITWDPWFGPYHQGWHAGWSWSPYWGYGWSYGAYWGYWGCNNYWFYNNYWNYGNYWAWSASPWYWDPYYYAGYWGGMGGNGRYHNGAPDGSWGHRYLGGSRNNMSNPTFRTSSSSGTSRGTVRRGGVDINNGGRGLRGNISGTGVRTSTTHTGRTTDTYSTGRYAKPASAITRQNTMTRTTNGRSDYSTASRSNSSSYNNTSRARSYNHGSNSSTRGSYNNPSYNNHNTSPSRSSYNSSSSSRSSSTVHSSSSSSRSSSYNSSSSSRSSSSSSRSSGGGGGGRR